MLQKKLSLSLVALALLAVVSACSSPSRQNETAQASANPTGATVRCADGTLSYSQHRQGTCSHHGGVAEWLPPPSASSPSEVSSPTPAPSISVATASPSPSPSAMQPSAADLFVDEAAGGWIAIENTDATVIYYNPTRTTPIVQGRLFKAWIKEALKSPIRNNRERLIKERETQGLKTTGYDSFRRSLDLYEINCINSTMRVTSSIDYDFLGHVLSSDQTPYARWEDVVPDSVGESILHGVCESSKGETNQSSSSPAPLPLPTQRSTPRVDSGIYESGPSSNSPTGATARCRDGT